MMWLIWILVGLIGLVVAVAATFAAMAWWIGRTMEKGPREKRRSSAKCA